MRLTRVYVDAPLRAGAQVELPTQAVAHVLKVLRLRAGDELTLFNGEGREYSSVIAPARGKGVSVDVLELHESDRESPLRTILVQAIPRGDRMDFVIQKATELGVSRIVPVLSKRSVVRLDEHQAETKVEHWRGVAASACEQCGRNRLPQLDAPAKLIDHLAAPSEAAVRLVLDPQAEHGALPAECRTVEIIVGPEGGFEDDELDAMRVAGVTGMKLGPRILRTEIAALAALAWLQTRYGDFIAR